MKPRATQKPPASYTPLSLHRNQGPSGRPSQTDQAKAKLSMTAKQAPETTHHPTEVLQEQGTWLQSHRALRQETSHRFPIQEKQTPFLQAERESRFEQYPEAGQSSLWVPEAPEPKPPPATPSEAKSLRDRRKTQNPRVAP